MVSALKKKMTSAGAANVSSCAPPAVQPAQAFRERKRVRIAWLTVALGLHAAAITLIAMAPPQRPAIDLPKVLPVTVALLAAPPAPAPQPAAAVPPPEPVSPPPPAPPPAVAAPEPPLPEPPPPEAPKPKPKLRKQARKPVEQKVARTEPSPAPAPAPVAVAVPAAPTATPAAMAAAAAEATPLIAPDLSAAYRNNPRPPYPSLSRRRGEEGKVLLRVLVTAQGAAEQVDIAKSSGYERLDEAAKEAVGRWIFVPARQAGRPVAATVIVPIRFRLDG